MDCWRVEIAKNKNPYITTVAVDLYEGLVLQLLFWNQSTSIWKYEQALNSSFNMATATNSNIKLLISIILYGNNVDQC